MEAFNSVRIVDVTLRDGGYRNNFQFKADTAKKVVSSLSNSGINIIEIGYRNSHKSPASFTAHVTKGFIDEVKNSCPTATLAVMVHPRNVNIGDFQDLKDSGINVIRVCIFEHDLDYSIKTIELAKDLGFMVTANIIRATHLNTQELDRIINKINLSKADVIYIADSNGNMIPEQVSRFIIHLKNSTSKEIGFHAHNNLSLALSNSISAISSGAKYIDVSLCGMGKGAGNLSVELLLAYFRRIGAQHNYNLVYLLQVSDFFCKYC